jgi:hypothetical protein
MYCFSLWALLPVADPPAPFQITEEQIQSLEEDGVVIIKGVRYFLSWWLCPRDRVCLLVCVGLERVGHSLPDTHARTADRARFLVLPPYARLARARGVPSC